jgi:hypothetical protein
VIQLHTDLRLEVRETSTNGTKYRQMKRSIMARYSGL